MQEKVKEHQIEYMELAQEGKRKYELDLEAQGAAHEHALEMLRGEMNEELRTVAIAAASKTAETMRRALGSNLDVHARLRKQEDELAETSRLLDAAVHEHESALRLHEASRSDQRRIINSLENKLADAELTIKCDARSPKAVTKNIDPAHEFKINYLKKKTSHDETVEVHELEVHRHNERRDEKMEIKESHLNCIDDLKRELRESRERLASALDDARSIEEAHASTLQSLTSAHEKALQASLAEVADVKEKARAESRLEVEAVKRQSSATALALENLDKSYSKTLHAVCGNDFRTVEQEHEASLEQSKRAHDAATAAILSRAQEHFQNGPLSSDELVGLSYKVWKEFYPIVPVGIMERQRVGRHLRNADVAGGYLDFDAFALWFSATLENIEESKIAKEYRISQEAVRKTTLRVKGNYFDRAVKSLRAHMEKKALESSRAMEAFESEQQALYEGLENITMRHNLEEKAYREAKIAEREKSAELKDMFHEQDEIWRRIEARALETSRQVHMKKLTAARSVASEQAEMISKYQLVESELERECQSLQKTVDSAEIDRESCLNVALAAAKEQHANHVAELKKQLHALSVNEIRETRMLMAREYAIEKRRFRDEMRQQEAAALQAQKNEHCNVLRQAVELQRRDAQLMIAAVKQRERAFQKAKDVSRIPE